MEPKRLNKFISDAGFCSRREADQLIAQGRVTINGKIPEAGTKVTAKDKVRIDDEILQVKEEETVFLVFNKPAGIATSTDLSVKNNIASALNYPAALLPIGLLDRDAEGLLFLSNDTELVRRMTKADNKFEKEYVVTVDKIITPDFLSKISEGGIPEPGTIPKKNFVAKEGSNRFRIVLAPNTNHHVKRMVEYLGYKVVHLQRVRVQDITLNKLPVRFWRKLTEAELAGLKSVLGKGNKGKATPKRDTDNFSEGSYQIRNRAPKQKSTFNKAAKPSSNSPKSNSNPKSASARASGNKPDARNSSSDKNTAPKSGGRRNSPPRNKK